MKKPSKKFTFFINLMTFFARFYTPGQFILFIKTTGRKVKFLPRLLTIFYSMQDKDTPKIIKLVLMGALGYVILPFDFIPDILPGLGWLDDAAVITAALHIAGAYVKPEHLEKVHDLLPFSK